MLNSKGAVILGEDIYVYPNFVSSEECQKILDFISLIPENEWQEILNPIGQGYEISFRQISELQEINKRVESILDSDVYLNNSAAPTRMKRGLIGTHHSDNFEFLNVREANKNLKEGEDFDLAKNNIAGLIIYFNDFEGGEIHYSNQNITYAPKAGDLLIHSSDEHCKHQVQEVKSDFRYSHSDNLFRLIKVPKGFKNVT
jgi:hypothetical protein